MSPKENLNKPLNNQTWWFPATVPEDNRAAMGVKSSLPMTSRIYRNQLEMRMSRLMEPVDPRELADLVSQLIPELAGRAANDPTTLADQVIQTDAAMYLLNRINWDQEKPEQKANPELIQQAEETDLTEILNLMSPPPLTLKSQESPKKRQTTGNYLRERLASEAGRLQMMEARKSLPRMVPGYHH